MSKVLYIDGPNLTMRALHAGLHGPMFSNGADTAALTIFINSLGKLVREEGPSYLGIAWDSPHKGFRHTLYEGYKANRAEAPVLDAKASTFALVREFCDLAGIRSLSCPTMEADDIIARLWYVAVQGPIVIASSDHDFLQLAGPNPSGVSTEVLRFGKENDRWDAAKVSEYHDSPEHYPLIAALAGDPSDNIPGIKGIGPKKAVKLLEKHDWDLESALDEYPEERERVRTFFQMIDLRNSNFFPLLADAAPVPVGEQARTASPELMTFLEDYELKGALAKFRAGTFWRAIPYRR
jgi:DNA polymerase-1